MAYSITNGRWSHQLHHAPRTGVAIAIAFAAALATPAQQLFAQSNVRNGSAKVTIVSDSEKQEADNEGDQVKDVVEVEGVQLSDRWMGVVCEPIEESLRAHLAVPEGVGMMVTSVVPGAPADRAGIQQFDILLTMNSKELKDVDGIVESVKNSDEKGIKVVLFRKGAEIAKTVVPEKRPEQTAFTVPDQGGWVAPNVDTEKVLEWVESLKAGKGKDGKLGLRFLGPGVEMKDNIEMPSDLSISITRKNDEPANITIKRGDESWEVTEDRLDELPEDIRPFVKRMTGQGGGIPHGFTLSIPEIPNIPDMPEGIDGGRWNEMEERIEDMRQKMEKMLEQMQNLRDAQEAPPEDVESEVESEDA